MGLPERVALYFEPDRVIVDAQIVRLTRTLYRRAMVSGWWEEEDLNPEQIAGVIDRKWGWFNRVDLDGEALACERVAIVTDDGQVQEAMIISTESVSSNLVKGQECLFVDQICTAPRNRQGLRRDGAKWFKGVGTKLLQWGSRLSVELGCEGKLWLLASPGGEAVYRRLGFEELNLVPVVYDRIEYKPMELPLEAVSALFEK